AAGLLHRTVGAGTPERRRERQRGDGGEPGGGEAPPTGRQGAGYEPERERKREPPPDDDRHLLTFNEPEPAVAQGEEADDGKGQRGDRPRAQLATVFRPRTVLHGGFIPCRAPKGRIRRFPRV